MDGARRLGRLARLLSIVSIVLGALIIIVYATVSGTEKKDKQEKFLPKDMNSQYVVL